MESLKLSSEKRKLLKNIYLPIRHDLIQEAIQFPNSHDSANKFFTTIYVFNDYKLKIGKPGKEYSSTQIKYRDGHKANNPNDMWPTTHFKGHIVPRIGTFEEIFKIFLKLIPNYDTLQLLGALFVRNAMTLDHIKNNEGNWRYSPPSDVIDEINKCLPTDFGEPLEVFLYYLELIALNEDTKYFTLGYDIATGIGRFNNLMTYAHIINIILLRRKLSEYDFLLERMKFAGGLVRPPVGLNPISLSKAINAFPQLKP